ncbi:NUDIX domain-containing protein [Litoribrevibacter albus]|uniref:ADP-ribose pyrophosphatase n=1 Tax=Litoribrevibacter albus TaxID=1473156 RepID=A0AA37SEC8_9GAMM|nr:NUDIX domain-containing protein [Litoribrevibacter albus]GLQ32494.1 ADP-ribose pyrophosphatase [Litoribrevibacter albus]
MAFSNMTNQDVEILEKKEGYRGFFRLNVYKLRHRLFDGGWSQEITRELFERGHAVGVLLHDPERECILMVEQFRLGVAVADKGDSPWALEIVAGMLDKNKPAEEVARMEAMEEAHCEVGALEHIHDYYSSTGGSSEHVKIFYGQIDSTGLDGRIAGLDEESEDIKVHLVPTNEIPVLLASGRVNNAMALIALQWFLLNKSSNKSC